MRRNRKREPLRFGTVARSLLVCGCVAIAGLTYVYQKNQIYRLGDEVKKREATMLAFEKRNALLAAQLAQFKSPAYLEARCQQYSLGLTAPRDTQIVRLPEPGAEWDMAVPKMAAAPAGAPAAKQSPAKKAAKKVVARR
jgi:cell division protein FtsB